MARSSGLGQAMIEFALIAPLMLLVFFGIVVTGIAVGNQSLLSNAVRDTARAAAICGSSLRDGQTQLPSTGSLGAQTCSWAALDAYASARLSQTVGRGALSAPSGTSNCQALTSGAALVCVFDSSDTAATINGNPLDSCRQGYKVAISSRYAQALYLPLVGTYLGSGGSTTTRMLSADAEAVCEQ